MLCREKLMYTRNRMNGWNVFMIMIILCVSNVTNKVISRASNYEVVHGKKIINTSMTYLNGPYFTRSDIECATMCKQSYKCFIAEFDKTMSLCTYHEFSPDIPYAAVNSDRESSILTGILPIFYTPTSNVRIISDE